MKGLSRFEWVHRPEGQGLSLFPKPVATGAAGTQVGLHGPLTPDSVSDLSVSPSLGAFAGEAPAPHSHRDVPWGPQKPTVGDSSALAPGLFAAACL